MDKFQYAPGRPGFGSRGDDGSAGLTGLSLYFTDYDTVTESAAIQAAIINNNILCSSTLYELNETPLPGGRTYNVGDIFIDVNGGVYEIVDPITGDYVYKFARLNTTGLFTSAEIETDTHRFKRYFNNNLDPKYLIDNVYASEEVNYYSVPSNIYDILTQNFTRIEFSNIVEGIYNPFTVYSSGENDNNAIAIVRDIYTNTFRIGNLDNNGNVRNVNLMFDVKSLMVNKEDKTTHFTPSTPAGTIVTNYEINANPLFEGNFNSNPSSFSEMAGHNYAIIGWDKLDFADDSDVIADLYVYKDVSAQTTINVNNCFDYRPIVYSDCKSSGDITITGLTETTPYKYYMNLSKNGWSRRSTVKSFTTSATPYLYLIHGSPNTYLWADASGVWDGSTRTDSSTLYRIDVSTNSVIGWFIDGVANPEDNPCPPYDSGVDWITCSPMEGSAGYSSFLVSVSRNTGSNRSAAFYVNSTATQRYMYIMQRSPGSSGPTPPVDPSPGEETPYISFTNDGILNTATLGNYTVDISIYMYSYAVLSNMSPNPNPGGGYAVGRVIFTRESPFYTVTCTAESNWQENGENPQTTTVKRTILNIGVDSSCRVEGDINAYQDYPVETYGTTYIKIVKAKYHDTGVDVSIVNNKWVIDYDEFNQIQEYAMYEAPMPHELQ